MAEEENNEPISTEMTDEAIEIFQEFCAVINARSFHPWSMTMAISLVFAEIHKHYYSGDDSLAKFTLDNLEAARTLFTVKDPNDPPDNVIQLPH